jgi:hypothetical protein
MKSPPLTNLERAAQCRRLASEVAGDPLADALLSVADDFDRRAVEAGETTLAILRKARGEA